MTVIERHHPADTDRNSEIASISSGATGLMPSNIDLNSENSRLNWNSGASSGRPGHYSGDGASDFNFEMDDLNDEEQLK